MSSAIFFESYRLIELQAIPPNIQTLLIWDTVPSELFLQIQSRDLRVISIPALVDDNSQLLHDQYLSWVSSTSTYTVDSVNNIDRFRLSTGTSIWWSSLIQEKCNFDKSPHINVAIKLLALHLLVPPGLFTQLYQYLIPGSRLSPYLHDVFEAKGCSFPTSKPIANPTPSQLDSFLFLFHYLRRYILNVFAGIAYLSFSYCRSLVSRLLVRSSGPRAFPRNFATTFITYTAGLSASSFDDGVLKDNPYWAHLPSTLHHNHLDTNWVYIYAKDDSFPSLASALSFLATLNRTKARSTQSHFSLDALHDTTIFFSAFYLFVCLAITSFRPKVALPLPTFGPLRFDRLHLYDFESSLNGSVAARNILYSLLFERLFSSLPPQKNVVYLQENMDWEYSAIDAARKAKVQNILGFPHSTMSFWDLRYSYPPLSSRGDVQYESCPLPDFILTSGPLNKSNLIRKNSSLQLTTVDVEALRYLNATPHLGESVPSSGNRLLPNPPSPLSIALLLPYGRVASLKLLRLFSKFLDSASFSGSLRCYVRFHPLCNLSRELSKISSGDISIYPGSLLQLLACVDIVVSSANSGVLLDAFLMGKKVFAVRDPNSLLISPLDSVPSVTFVPHPDDLFDVLRQHLLVGNYPLSNPVDPSAYLLVDSDLHRWLDIISI